MTIERGSDWGEIVRDHVGGMAVTGDLARELGVDPSLVDAHRGTWLKLPLDVVDVVATDAGGKRHERTVTSWLIVGSHVRGEYAIVSSTSFVGGRRIFSRAHPNDGRLDWLMFHPSMTFRQRLAFRRRTRTESHLPHPQITVGTGPVFARAFTRPLNVRFESARPIRSVVELTATMRPDASVTHIPAP